MTKSRVLRGAIATLAATGLVTGAIMAPAKAATRTTVVVVESNAFTSLNPTQADSNLVINSDIGYLTGMGFNYYNDKFQIIRNTKFGYYKIVSQSPFKVEWHINAGRVWSDGTPITAHDLLLSQIICSSAYSKAAGLGDPDNTDATPAFNSLCYTGLWDKNVTNVSITPDRLGVVVTYKTALADYEQVGPGVFPVHTLVALAAGEKKLGTTSHNIALKNKFLTAYSTKDTATLKKYGKIWSESYLVNSVDAKTNPLLLVNNGAYLR
jgi:peptide/nickel transport system substrate-binding protein